MEFFKDHISQEQFDQVKEIVEGMLDFVRSQAKVGEPLTNMQCMLISALLGGAYMFDCPDEAMDNTMEIYIQLVKNSIKAIREKQPTHSLTIN